MRSRRRTQFIGGTLALASVVTASMAVVVRTTSGLVQGKESCNGGHCVDAFLGVPYAEPPVLELRFQKPVPKEPWGGIWNATDLPPPCFQGKGNLPHVPWESDEARAVEGCLYLNVWLPREKRELIAVMIWIHGGSYRIGSTDLDMYNGETLAVYGRVIVVSMNYRLGSLGFMFGDIPEAPGNMGLWDQHLAIRWVKTNIGAFGGDVSRMTVFGESVGGASAGMHAVSPLSTGLFNGVIMQSGTPMWPLPMENEGGPERALKLARSAGCVHGNDSAKLDSNTVRCLQGLSAEDILRAELPLFPVHLFTFFPKFGDELVPMHPAKAIKEGRMNAVGVLVGYNMDEGSIAYYTLRPKGIPDAWSTAGIDLSAAKVYISSFFGKFMPPAVDSVADHYLTSVEGLNSAAVFKAMTESTGDFLFNLLKDIRMTRTVMNAWTSFARTGTPDLPRGLLWRSYGSRGHPYAHFQDGRVCLRSRPSKEDCDFWRRYQQWSPVRTI